MDATESDWRTTFKPDDRQKLVDKLMESLKNQLPVSSLEGLVEIATTFEEKMYTTATSQTDYLRKISMTLLAMETKSETTDTANTEESNSDGVAQKPPNPAPQSMQSQELNQGRSHVPLLNQQSQAQQQLLSQAQQSMQSQELNQGRSHIPLLNQQSRAQKLLSLQARQQFLFLQAQQQLPSQARRLPQAQQQLPSQARRLPQAQQQYFQASQQQVSSQNVRNGTIPNIPNTGVLSIDSFLSSLMPSVTNMQSRIGQNSIGSTSISQGLPHLIPNTGVQSIANSLSSVPSVTNMQSRTGQNSIGSTSISQGLPHLIPIIPNTGASLLPSLPSVTDMQSRTGQNSIGSTSISQGLPHLIPIIPNTGASLLPSLPSVTSMQSRTGQNSMGSTSISQGPTHLIPNIPNTGASLLPSLPSVTNMQSRVAQNSVGSSISQGLPPNVSSLNLPMQSWNPQVWNIMLLRKQQIEYFRSLQRYMNQHIHQHIDQQIQHLLKQQQQQHQELFQKQQIPQLQQQFQQLTLQQQSVLLNGGAYNFPTATTTPQPFQVTTPLETSDQQHSTVSSSQIHEQQQQHQKQEKQQPLLPISLPKTITPPLQSDAHSPSNVVSAASLSTPLLEKDPEKQSLVAESTTPYTTQKLYGFILYCSIIWFIYLIYLYWD